mmetsp:Transcript_69618/g.167046  ORF Transcript_69618/g.167046 Transcript_69618/m.167046 type:complete len:357 (-) Transcript_69618:864-1934(-)
MPTKDDVNLFHLLRKELVVWNSHVRQGNDYISSPLFLQLLSQPTSASYKVLISHLLHVNCSQGYEPFFLDKADQPDLAPMEVNSFADQTFPQWAACVRISCVAEKPWKIGLLRQRPQVIDTKIKVMVSIDCCFDSHSVESRHHMFSQSYCGDQRGAQCITAEEDHRLLFTTREWFHLQLTNPGDKPRNSSHGGCAVQRFNVIHIIEMQDCHAFQLLTCGGCHCKVCSANRLRFLRGGYCPPRVAFATLHPRIAHNVDGDFPSIAASRRVKDRHSICKSRPRLHIWILQELFQECLRHSSGKNLPCNWLFLDEDSCPNHLLTNRLQRAVGEMHAIVCGGGRLLQAKLLPVLQQLRSD